MICISINNPVLWLAADELISPPGQTVFSRDTETGTLRSNWPRVVLNLLHIWLLKPVEFLRVIKSQSEMGTMWELLM